ncbi:MAG: hypothetical protein R3F61_18410 [Myxococcota bacterium]
MGDEEAMPCRACGGGLEEVEVEGRLFWMCRGCGSTLVEQRDLIPVLTSAARAIADAVSFDEHIDPVPPAPAPACPDCDRKMEAFGYMGTHLAFPARCAPCSLVWMGPEVMGVMTLLFARTNLRHDTRVADMQAQLAEMDRRMTAVVMNRVRESWMMR